MKFLLCSLLIVCSVTISIDAQASPPASNCTSCEMALSPLYHLVRADNYHFYTSSKDEADRSVASYGFKYDVSPGMIALNALDCNCHASLPYLTRLYRPTSADPNAIDEHVYTCDSDAIGNYINNLKYRWEGYEPYRFYCSTVPGSCGATVPLFNYIQNWRHRFATTTKGQVGTFDGIACYIWPNSG